VNPSARTLVLGGTRSGKSAWAEAQAGTSGAVTYVATAPPRTGDAEWDARVAAHRVRRPAAWDTVETGADPAALVAAVRDVPAGRTLLVDDLGGWITTALDAARAWDHPAGAATVGEPCDALVAAVRGCRSRLLLVSPEVGWGVVPATRAGRLFADAHGRLNQRLAAVCDDVVLVVAGLPLPLKGDGVGRVASPP
jgi:adenosyl cobinamide kinase/adenosyl cobinamide phosphate guanylyltransferase